MTADVGWAIIAGLGLGVGLWVLLSLTPPMRRPRLAARIAPYLLDVSAGARDVLAPAAPGPSSVFGVLFEPLLARLRPLLASVLGGDELLARRLRQAGSSATVEGFRGQQILAGVAGVVLGVAVAIVVARAQNVPIPALIVIVAVLGATGVVVRDWVLQQAARRRIRRLADELPVVLELLTLSLSAGEGVLDGLRRIARVGRGELAGELSRVVADVGSGLPLAECIWRMARDLDLPSFTRFAEQLTGALERGTPLAEVLRAQAQDARDESKRELLESAGRKEVAMLFPRTIA